MASGATFFTRKKTVSGFGDNCGFNGDNCGQLNNTIILVI